jgi:hypothetical protein
VKRPESPPLQLPSNTSSCLEEIPAISEPAGMPTDLRETQVIFVTTVTGLLKWQPNYAFP